MRVVHISHQYPVERRGGVELYTQALARWQANAGHWVAVLHGWADRVNGPPLALRETDGAVAVYAATPRPARHPLELFVRSFHNPDFDRAFATLLDDLRPNVVHVQHMKGLSARLVEIARGRGLPVVWTLHDWWAFCGNAQLVRHTGQLCDGPRLWVNCADCAAHHGGVALNPAQTALARAATPVVASLFAFRARLLDRAFRAASAQVAPSAFVRNRFAQQGFPTDRLRVIPLGLDLPPTDDRRPTSAEPPVGTDDRRLGGLSLVETTDDRLSSVVRFAYIGGLAWQKGIHILIEAFSRLPVGRATLTIYGDPRPFPDYVARLKSLAAHPGITFAGPFAEAARWEVLTRHDVFVVPSVWPETFNLVAREAFAAGRLVIASQVGALAEAVRDGVDGLLVPPGDPAALAQAMTRLVDDPALLARLRAGVQAPRTLADHAAAVERLYQEVAIQLS